MRFKVDEAARHGEAIRKMLKDSTKRARRGWPVPARNVRVMRYISRWIAKAARTRAGVTYHDYEQVFVRPWI